MRRAVERVCGVVVSVYLDGEQHGQPAVVLLHGGGLMGATWGRVCDRLSARWQCVAPDLRGHGDTDWDADGYSLAGYARDLRDLLVHLGLDRPHLVGMSLGGQSALHAVSHGLDVASLTLVDIGPRSVQSGGRYIRDFVDATSYGSFEAALSAAQQLQPRRSAASLERSLLRSMRQDEQGRWAWKWDPLRLDSREDRVREAEELWPLLRRVTCPTLVVRGAQSPVLSDELAVELVDELPNGRLVTIEGAGHAVQTDQPEELARALGHFLASV